MLKTEATRQSMLKMDHKKVTHLIIFIIKFIECLSILAEKRQGRELLLYANLNNAKFFHKFELNF